MVRKTRRRFVGMVGATALTIGIAGCGDNGDGEVDDDDLADAADEAADAADDIADEADDMADDMGDNDSDD